MVITANKVYVFFIYEETQIVRLGGVYIFLFTPAAISVVLATGPLHLHVAFWHSDVVVQRKIICLLILFI